MLRVSELIDQHIANENIRSSSYSGTILLTEFAYGMTMTPTRIILWVVLIAVEEEMARAEV
jgi:hypothetical protein